VATRRNGVFAITEDNGCGDIGYSNARKGDRITRVELALSLCMIAEGRDHKREGRACGESDLSGARMKYHL
jgi:hypothetical protein